MRSSDWVRARVQKIDLYSPPSVASGGRILLRPYNRVRAILRNTHAIPRPGTCGPSKNYPVFVPLRDRLVGVCDTPLRPGICDSSKYQCNFPTEYVLSFEKPPRFRPLRGRLWGVCDTPLRPGMCDSSKYRCDPPTGYV